MKQITVDIIQQWVEEGLKFHLIDVREDFEHEEFNLGGQLIPLNEISNNASQIPLDIPVVIYCRKGIRSLIAIQRLQQKKEFTNLYNLQGGTTAWIEKLNS